MDKHDKLMQWCDQYSIPIAGLYHDTSLVIDNPLYSYLNTLPPEIDNLQNLKEISINRTQLTSLPNEIGNLKNLETLDLYHNQLNELPPSIGNLKGLKKLVVSNNNLTSIPTEIKSCTNLSELWIKDNPISKDEINKIKNLLPNCIVHHD